MKAGLTIRIRCKNSPGCEGFTLLEVIVALALLGISLAAIFQLLSINLRGISTSAEHAGVVLKAESEMRDFLSRDSIEEGSSTKFTEDGYRVVISVARSSEQRTENLGVQLYEIAVTVGENKDMKPKEYTLKTLKTMKKKL